MARKTQDRAKAKAQKQKKLAIGGAVLLAAVLVIQVPKTMKLLNNSPKAPVETAASTTPAASAATPPVQPAAAAPATPSASAAAPSTQLVAAVNAVPDVGQLAQFQRFASKDPFATQVSAGAAAASRPAVSTATAKTPAASSSSPAQTSTVAVSVAPAVPTSAVIGVNGVLGSVAVGGAFPLSGAVFNRVGSLFQLVSLTATTAKVAIVGGSYASGAPTLTLKLGHPVTLQNTADGTRYTLVLEPPGTPLQTTAASAAPTVPVAPSAASSSVVPSGSGG